MSSSAPAIREKSVRVMVVDDYPPYANLVARILGENGHAVRVFHDGADCLREAENFRPQALVADALLKGMSGFEVAVALAHRFPECRVLLISVDPLFLPDHGPFKVAKKSEIYDALVEFLAGCGADE